MSDRLGTGNNASQMNNHIQDHSNPHVTTASQVGADVLGSASTVQANLDLHVINLNNPHSTTASQVGAVVANTAISAGTSTKVQYDVKGLILSGSQATTADINDSTNRRYVTDANLVVIGNTSGVNTGNQVVPSQTASASGIFLTGYNSTTGSFTSASASSNSAGITSASGVAPINVSNGSVISLNTTGISSGSYNAVTVDTFGRIISGSNIYPSVSGSFYTGSAVIVVTGSIISHSGTGISSGSYTAVTVDARGHVISGSNPVIDHTVNVSNVGVNTHTQIDTALTRLVNTTGSNTGDQTVPSLKTSTVNLFLTGYNNTTGSFTTASAVTSTSGISFTASGVSPISVSGGSIISLDTTGISSGSYNAVYVDTFGRITSGSNIYATSSGSIYTGSAVISVTGSIISHLGTGITSGSYNSVTVDSRGHIISGSNIYPVVSGSFYTGSAVINITGSIVSHLGTGIASGSYSAITVDARGHVISGSNPVLDHTVNVLNVGNNTHAQIDTALTRLINTTGSNTGDQIIPSNTVSSASNVFIAYNSATGSFTKTRLTWNDVDKTISNIADITTKDHTSLSSVGVNTHAQIDTALTRLANTSGNNTGDQTVPVNKVQALNQYFVAYNSTTGSFTSGSITASGSYSASGVAPINVSDGYIVSHNDSGVSSGSYNAVYVDAKGHVTAGSNISTGQTYAGSAVISVAGSIISHLGSGMTTGSYTAVTVDSRGHIISGSNPVLDHTINISNVGVNTHTQIDTALTRLVNTTGSNTGDQVVPTNTALVAGQFFTAYNSSTGSFSTGSAAGVTTASGVSPISVSGGSVISLDVTGISSGSYNAVTVDTFGRIISGSNIYPTVSGSFYTGSAIISITGSIVSHLGSGMVTGSYTAVTVDTRGHIISGSNPVLDHTVNMSNVGINTHAQIDTALTRLVNTTGSNTGDQTVPSLKVSTLNFFLTGYNNTTGLFTTGSAVTSASVFSFSASGVAPISVSGGSIISLDVTGVTSGSYNQFTVDVYGRVTSASFISSSAVGGTTYSGSAPITITGSVISHDNSGVTSGSFTTVYVDTKGHVFGGRSTHYEILQDDNGAILTDSTGIDIIYVEVS